MNSYSNSTVAVKINVDTVCHQFTVTDDIVTMVKRVIADYKMLYKGIVIC